MRGLRGHSRVATSLNLLFFVLGWRTVRLQLGHMKGLPEVTA